MKEEQKHAREHGFDIDNVAVAATKERWIGHLWSVLYCLVCCGFGQLTLYDSSSHLRRQAAFLQ